LEDSARTAITLFAPLLLGFAIHGVCMRTGLLRALAKPIDGGRRRRGAAELPNRLLKRRLGIAPGTQAGGMLGPLFHVLDQVDVVVGAWAVLVWVVRPDLGALLAALVFVDVAHQLVTVAGFALGMRATWR
jgi:hypothetical protein